MTTAKSDEAMLMQLAVDGLYPKIFDTAAIMNGYPRKCPEEVSEMLQEFQFPTAQTVVRNVPELPWEARYRAATG